MTPVEHFINFWTFGFYRLYRIREQIRLDSLDIQRSLTAQSYEDKLYCRKLEQIVEETNPSWGYVSISRFGRFRSPTTK